MDTYVQIDNFANWRKLICNCRISFFWPMGHILSHGFIFRWAMKQKSTIQCDTKNLNGNTEFPIHIFGDFCSFIKITHKISHFSKNTYSPVAPELHHTCLKKFHPKRDLKRRLRVILTCDFCGAITHQWLVNVLLGFIKFILIHLIRVFYALTVTMNSLKSNDV